MNGKPQDWKTPEDLGRAPPSGICRTNDKPCCQVSSPPGLQLPEQGRSDVSATSKREAGSGSSPVKLLQRSRCAQGNKQCLTIAHMLVVELAAAACH
jgi:hypothetical protein